MDDAGRRASYRIVELRLKLAEGLPMQSLMEKNKNPNRPLPGEEERQARLQKMKGLRYLRSYGCGLRFDPTAQFHDVIDCTALLESSIDGDGEQWKRAAFP